MQSKKKFFPSSVRLILIRLESASQILMQQVRVVVHLLRCLPRAPSSAL